MSLNQKVIYLDEREKNSVSPEKVKTIVSQINEIMVNNSKLTINSVLDKIDDSLFDMAEKAETTQIQSSLLDAMREVRRKRKSCYSQYLKSIQENSSSIIHNLISGNINNSDNSTHSLLNPEASDELSLIAEEKLEQSLAINGIISKARLRSSSQISDLKIRLEYLLSNNEIEDQNNPYDPSVFVHSFADAAEQFNLELNIELVVYKIFDKAITADLDNLYHEINALLIDNNILPKISANMRRKNKDCTTPKNNTTENTSATDKNTPDNYQSNNNQEYSQADHSLLDSLKKMIHQGDSPCSINKETAQEALVSILSNSQKEIASHTGNSHFADNPESIRKIIEKNYARENLKIDRESQDIIDIVGMLFSYIIDDIDDTDDMRSTMSQLHLPLIKLAAIDRSFFDNKEHPARNLINLIAKTTRGFSGESESSRKLLKGKVETIVNSIVNDFTNDISLFEELLSNFQEFIDKEKERIKAIEERTQQAEKNKLRVDSARKIVEEEINSRIMDISMPESVENMLSDAWSKYLFITYLKEGVESEIWNNGLETVSNLAWSLTPKNNQKDKNNLLLITNKVQRQLREGLNSILYNPFEISKLFKDLNEAYKSILEETDKIINQNKIDTDIKTQKSIKPSIENITTEKTEPRKEAAKTNEESKKQTTSTESKVVKTDFETEKKTSSNGNEEKTTEISKSVFNFEIGTWFEFNDGNEKIRARLSANLAHGKRLIFVNRSGFKLAEKSISQLEQELNNGSTIMLDDSQLFDRALESVVNNLRQMRQ